MLLLDKPVVDQTGITGRFDNNVTFTPDDWQFNGHPPKVPRSTASEAPNLFDAIQQQLGLKLTAQKTRSCDRHRPRGEAFAKLTLRTTPPFALS